ncbi:MAG: VOC family protein [Phycisphaerae bacterium]|nr:VOC family protein [Phycisphaerae bacterium]
MRLDHIAIWTNDLECLRNYYVKFFNGVSNEKYTNEEKEFHSYFISFDSGARLEIMTMPTVSSNLNDTKEHQHTGLIHLAFELDCVADVDAKAKVLIEAGFEILDGPRITGDGYYEFVTLDPDNNRVEVTALP